MYVTCAELCEIGTELVCSVLLPGGPRKLRGRVVRLVALPRAVGIAITFLDLKEADRLVLERLVGSRLRGALPAKLRVGGFDHDLRCEAVMGEHKMRVSTTLPPFLRQGAGVDVGVALDESCDITAHGVISRIALDPMSSDGVPRLSLDVDIGDEAADTSDDAPPSGLPRPYGHPQPSVLVSRRYARDLASDPPRAPRRSSTAEMPGHFSDDAMPLMSPPARELTLRMFALAAQSGARHVSALWLALPLLFLEAACILLSRAAH
jgi:hypothetical protein